MKKENTMDAYERGVHRYGRIWIIICESLFVAAPLLIAWKLGVTPNAGAFFSAFAIIAVLNWSAAIAEFFMYTPLIGPSATYLAFITGNISNLKLPCAINTQDVVGVKRGTKEAEIISTIAVASSSLVTLSIMSVGVVFLALFAAPMQAFFENPAVKPVFDCILPSLFGALGYSYIVKKPKLGIVPLIFVAVVFVAFPTFANKGSVAIMILVTAVVSLVSAFFISKKEILK
ncbi:MAG: hypothetical protein LBT20_04295 [Clostridiales bacterium]|jgi:hypothetical protein|nr:hypothetical protein [Clostridiales bacterium]